MRRASFVASALALALPAAALSASERPLTLREAFVRALEKNDSIVLERETFASAQAAVIGAKGAYDPMLTVASDWERATTPVNSAFSGAPAGQDAPTLTTTAASAGLRQLLPTGGSVALTTTATRSTTDGAFTLLSPAYATEAGIEARQPLLRDRATDPARTALKVASADRDRAAASLRREVTEVIGAVERSYWTLVAARRDVGVREEAVRLADEQLHETRIRAEKGAVPETEIAQPRAELERRRGELLASSEAVARADSGLKRLILGDSDPAWSERLAPVDDPETPVATPDLDEAMDRALRSRPELDAAQAAVERRRSESRLARDAVRPSLDVVASYARYGLAGDGNTAATAIPGFPSAVPSDMDGGWGRAYGLLGEDRFSDARFGLELSIPLGNRTARAGATVARGSQRQAEADLSQTRKAVRAEVLDAAAALDTAGQRIEAARSAREAAEVQLGSERDRYAAGLSTNFLVLTRQNDLSRARLDEIAALTDYRMARAELARATGSLLEERHIDIDAVEGRGTAVGEP